MVRNNVDPTYGDLYKEIEVFQWLESQQNPSTDQTRALITNLAPLGEEGLDIARAFLDKHGRAHQLDSLLESCKKLPVANYQTFALLGFDGDLPEGYANPLEELKALKKARAMKLRGLYYHSDRLCLNANTFAKYVLRRRTLVYVNGQGFFTYEPSGVWRPMERLELEKLCRDILHEAEDGIWKKSWSSEYISALELEAELVEKMDKDLHFINLRNGMIDLRTMDLEPHHPSYYSTVQVPVKYNPDAKCPQFKRFLESVFDGDQERINLVQEIMGYVLTKERRLQKAFIFYGVGANGKSVLAEVIRHIAGPDNVSNVPLAKLTDRFGLDNLPGKTVNISTENELGDKHLNTQNFKAITGGDVVNVEQKYKDSFSCELFCKLLISVNQLPKTLDHSHGYYRRLVIVPFQKVFREEEQDPNLLDKLLTELEGILVFALEGYQRLYRNDYRLSPCQASEKALAAYKAEQNPVLLFVREELRFNPGSSARQSELYPAFQNWARRNGCSDYNPSRQRFWHLFKAACAELGLKFSQKKANGIVHIENFELLSNAGGQAERL